MRKIIVISLLAWVLSPTPGLGCGAERWPVKTLADPKAAVVLNSQVQRVMVAALTAKQSPDRATLEASTSVRFPEELSRYEVTALVVGYKKEADEDFHIVIADPANPKKTMIAEIPSSDCVPQQFNQQFALLQAGFVRDFGKPTAKYKRLKTPLRVVVTGVGFFDFLHGQTGVAPNGFELHPVLSIEKVSPNVDQAQMMAKRYRKRLPPFFKVTTGAFAEE